MGFVDGGQTGDVDPGVAHRETAPSIDRLPDLARSHILADQPCYLRPAVPRHFGHKVSYPSLGFPAQLSVILLPQSLPDPSVNLLPAVPTKAHLLARFQ